jgi:hypothetical protein
VVNLWGRQWSRGELLARVGRPEQLASVQLVEAADGAEIAYPAPPGTCVSDASSPDYRHLEGPEPAFVEECYEHDMVPGPDGYVTAAVEPGTNRDAGRFDARERGELIFQAPGEQRHYELELGALTGVAAVEAFRGRNEELVAGAAT